MVQKRQTQDRRVQKTEALLRDALISLVREKAYDSIVVKEILDRANVGRTAFYAHFRDKDELLASSIREIFAARSRSLPPPAKPYEKIIRFSLPIFEFIHQHRHDHQSASDAMMDAGSQAVLHRRLQNVLTELMRDEVEQYVRDGRTGTGRLPPDVLTNYLATTFILVLGWWLETERPLAPNEVNDLYRGLVLPTLVSALNK